MICPRLNEVTLPYTLNVTRCRHQCNLFSHDVSLNPTVDEVVSSGLHPHPDAEEIFDQMCGRNGVVVALVGNSRSNKGNGMVVAERNGMVENSVIDPHYNDVDCNGSSVGCKESDVDGSRRGGNGKECIVDGSSQVTSDVTPSIFQIATLARKKIGQLFQPVRKLDFTPAKLLEKLNSDKDNESDIVDDDKILLLDSVHMKHGRLTNLEIAFILAIRAITGSSLACTYICAPITGRPSYLLLRKIAKLVID